MKSFYLFYIAVAFLFSNTEFQQKKTEFQKIEAMVEAGIKKKVDETAKLLSLTNEQIKKVHIIEADLHKQESERIMKALGDLYAQIKIRSEINKIRLEKYMSVLTVDQFKIFKEHIDYWESLQNELIKHLPDTIKMKKRLQTSGEN